MHLMDLKVFIQQQNATQYIILVHSDLLKPDTVPKQGKLSELLTCQGKLPFICAQPRSSWWSHQTRAGR